MTESNDHFIIRKLELLHHRRGDGLFDDLVDRQRRLGALDVERRAPSSPGCRGVNSVQQSWSGMIEIGYVPSRCASAVISSLSMPISGRSTGIVTTLVDRRQVLERLRRDLADDFAGDERLRAVAAARSPRRCASSAAGR